MSTENLAVTQRIKGFFSSAAYFWNGVTGADKYQKYLAYHRSTGCSSAPMSEREFWRDYIDRQDRNPQGRCC